MKCNYCPLENVSYNLFMNQVLENCDDLFGIKGDLVLGNIETGAMILTPDFKAYLDILRSVGQIQIKGKGSYICHIVNVLLHLTRKYFLYLSI
jgi:hypothetical protein